MVFGGSMSDCYSLKLRNRMALEGEELVAHRFANGSISMVACIDFDRWRHSVPATTGNTSPEETKGFWRCITNAWSDFLSYYGFTDSNATPSHSEPGPIVSIPSDALLRVFGISTAWQIQYHLGSFEDALLVELSPPFGSSRDGLCFGNDVTIPLQLLQEGQKVKILRRSWSESLDPMPELVQVRS